MKLLLALLISMVTALTALAETPAGEASLRPGVNDKYLSPSLDVDKWVARFEGESRQIYRAREEIIDALRLQRGMRVADIGAGTGLFARPIARNVGNGGKVYAVEISPRFLEHLGTVVAEERLTQVEIVKSTDHTTNLSAESIDLAFICDVYHHFEYPRAMLASLRAALRPGGELVVIDFKRIPGESEDWIIDHVRAGQEVFTQEISRAGFVLVEVVSIDSLRDNYVLRFRRP